DRLGLWEHTLGAVTIATPHAGTAAARLAPGVAARQIQPGSGLPAALPPLNRAHQPRWLVIQGGDDLPAPPAPVAHTAPHRLITLPGYGHLGVLAAPCLPHLIVGHLRCLHPTAAAAQRRPVPACA
ncbi:hypothetical protein ABT169_30235, partial [Streptomyces sp. NPDC001616]